MIVRSSAGVPGPLVVVIALALLGAGCRKPRSVGADAGTTAPSSSAALSALLGPDAPPPRPAPVRSATVLTEGPSLRVLHKGTFLGKGSDYGSLVGVRPVASQAVVREGSGLVQTFDYERGAVVEQWQQTRDSTSPIEASDPSKIAPELRWADLVRSLPSQPPGDVRPWGRILMSPDGKHVVYPAPVDGASTTKLMVADARAEKPRELATASIDTASFSPDSSMLAWIVAGRVPTYPHGGVRAGEPVRPSEVFVADVAGAADARPRHLTRPNELLRAAVWSRDGSRLYLLSSSEYGVGKACLLEADPRTLDTVREVHCPAGFSVLLDLAIAPDGRTGVLFDRSNLVWIDLAGGKVKAQRRPEQVALSYVRVSSSGIVVTPAAGDGIVLLDLESDRETRIKPANGYYGGLDSARWLDDRRLAFLHQGKGVQGFELIALDVDLAVRR